MKETINAFGDAAKEFANTLIFRKAAALTFFSIFTIIPCMAAVVILSNTCGLDAEILSLVEHFSVLFGIEEESVSAISNYISESLRIGSVGFLVGVPLLLWSVSSTYSEVERMFNEIYEEDEELDNEDDKKQKQNIIIKTILSLFPKIKKGITTLLVIFVVMTSIVLINRTFNLTYNGIVSSIEGFFALLILLFLSYRFIPKSDKMNTGKVLLTASITSLVIVLTTVVFSLLAKLCFSYDKVYGSLIGCLIVFLVYVRIVWAEVLFGAIWQFKLQYGEEYKIDINLNSLVHIDKEAILIYVLDKLEQEKKEEGYTLEDVKEYCGLNSRVAIWAINKLVSAKILIKKDGKYKKSDDSKKLEDLLKALNTEIGVKDKLGDIFKNNETVLENIKKAKEKIEELYIKPLPESEYKQPVAQPQKKKGFWGKIFGVLLRK